MKKSKLVTNIFAFSLLFLLIDNPIFAATPTPTKSSITPSPTSTKPTPIVSKTAPTDAENIEKIQRIKDIVASKVAELNLVEKRGIIGTITETSSTQVTVKDLNDKTRIIDIDDITKFISSKKNEEFGVSDLKKGVKYAFVGTYNKDTKRLLARTVSQTSTIPINFEGIVSKVDEDNFQIEVVDEMGKKKKIDIEKSTKTNIYDKKEDLTKSGFSEIELQQRILIVGFSDIKEKDLISASRIIVFEKIPPSRKMQSFISVDEEVNISSGSGKKLETKSLKSQ